MNTILKSQNQLLNKDIVKILMSGLGGFFAILALGHLGSLLSISLLIAPFGASCVIAFALPESPLAQPRNIIGGHMLSSIIGVTIFKLLGVSPWSLALGVGLSISIMLLTKTTHPPAGADPIVTMLIGADWNYVFIPITAGAFLLFAVALVYHKLRGVHYPIKWF